MSNRSKGNLHEKKVADYLKGQGYLTERSFGKPGWRPGRGLVFCARDLWGFCDGGFVRELDENTHGQFKQSMDKGCGREVQK